MSVSAPLQSRRFPQPRAALELLKPITWFPPVWAYACGIVAVPTPVDWGVVALGVLIAGPVVCGMSQAANDWCDREVDAINEPHRPIPSGRMPGRWGLGIALAMTVLSICLGWFLGPYGFAATCLAVAAAWAYSAPPLRLKRSGILGPGLVGLSYETLPWITGAAVLSTGAPPMEVVAIALLYGLGAHGIMTLNDFKALEGDRATGIASLPVVLGPGGAARVACLVMLAAQIGVIALLLLWGAWVHVIGIVWLLAIQIWAMNQLLSDPAGRAAWYNGPGVGAYVLGMLIAAFALRGLGA
ncbi:MAG: chlorophyll synthase ChlG [Shimia sp.]